MNKTASPLCIKCILTRLGVRRRVNNALAKSVRNFLFSVFRKKILCEEVARVGETMEPSKAIKRQDEKARNKKIKGNLATQLACMSS